jgi:DNA-directed RNA polymerase subunit RPC12/RpoP
MSEENKDDRTRCNRCWFRFAVTMNDFVPGPDLENPKESSHRYVRPVCAECDARLKVLEKISAHFKDNL